MGLLLVSAPDGDMIDGSETWKAIVSGLAAAKRDTDVIGWFERGNALGVILPDIDAPGPVARKRTGRADSPAPLAVPRRDDDRRHRDAVSLLPRAEPLPRASLRTRFIRCRCRRRLAPGGT